jgi:hypothetical protein
MAELSAAPAEYFDRLHQISAARDLNPDPVRPPHPYPVLLATDTTC